MRDVAHIREEFRSGATILANQTSGTCFRCPGQVMKWLLIYIQERIKTCCAFNAPVLDPASTTLTKTVMGLLQKGNLLGKGHLVYMDNYYSGPDLFWELFSKETCLWHL